MDHIDAQRAGNRQPSPQQQATPCYRRDKAHREWLHEGLDHLDFLDEIADGIAKGNLHGRLRDDLAKLERFIRKAMQKDRIRYLSLTP